MIFGADVSHWQGSKGLNAGKLAGEGFDFVMVKVSEGSGFRDPSWPTLRDQSRAAGLITIGYHYVTTDPPELQAANCRRWIGDPTIPVMVDWEEGGGDFANALAVIVALRAVGLTVPLGYFPRWYWEEQGRPDLRPAGVRLISSRYPTNAPGCAPALFQRVPVHYWNGYGGLVPSMLQFSSHATTQGIEIDADAYRGDRAGLLAALAPSDPLAHRDSEDAVALVSFDATPLPSDVPGGARWQDVNPANWPLGPEQKTALVHAAPSGWRGRGSVSSITCGWAHGRTAGSDPLADPSITPQDGPAPGTGELKASGWLEYLRVFHFPDGDAHQDWQVTELYTGIPLIGNKSLPQVFLPDWCTFLVARYSAPGGLYLGIEWEH